jgi:hypothetical protein
MEMPPGENLGGIFLIYRTSIASHSADPGVSRANNKPPSIFGWLVVS